MERYRFVSLKDQEKRHPYQVTFFFKYTLKKTSVVGSSLVQNRLASTLLFQNRFLQKALKPLKKANNLDVI